jgi:hypothetical protein
MTDREAFKIGFLGRCIEDGLTLPQIEAAVKTALDKAAILGKLLDVGAGVGKSLLSKLLPLAIVAPPIVGGLGGYGLAKATDIHDTDVAEIKDRELMDEYKRQTDRMLREKALRDVTRSQRRLPGLRI